MALMNQDKSLWEEDGTVCSFWFLDLGHRSQTQKPIQLHFFQLVTPSDELPESPSGLCFLRPAPVPNQAGVALSAVTLCAGSVLWVLLPARGYLPRSAQGTGFSS